LDGFSFQPRFLSAEEILVNYQPVLITHETPRIAPHVLLCDSAHPIPKSAELSQVSGPEFYVIKNQRPDTEQCKFTLGVGLARPNDKLFASYGFNRGEENTPTERLYITERPRC
jgi:hypothetical protein